jgi:dihydrofolate reductase
MKAIAAMTRNRVIGRAGAIPWHLPEDFRWFKRATMGGALLMGRKTYASIGRPLPGRLSLVVTRGAWPATGPDVRTVPDLATFRPEDYAPRVVWVAGGAEIYRQTLASCEELYLTVLDREADGDTFFPPFEEDFELAEVVLHEPEFEVRRYLRATSLRLVASLPPCS